MDQDGGLCRLPCGQERVEAAGSERDTAWWDGDHSRRQSAAGFAAVFHGGDAKGVPLVMEADAVVADP